MSLLCTLGVLGGQNVSCLLGVFCAIMVLPCHRYNGNLNARSPAVVLLASLMRPAPEAWQETAARGNQFCKPDGSFIHIDPSYTPRAYLEGKHGGYSQSDRWCIGHPAGTGRP